MPVTYRVVEILTQEELEPLKCKQYQVRGLPTGEKRVPEPGEFFISGPCNEVYRACAGLMARYRIVKLVATKENVLTYAAS